MSLLDISRFMPHGHCYSWDPGILWTSVISDSLIAAAYIAIPFTLVFQIMRKRNDLPFNWMFVCFGLFIVACGFTHVLDIVTVWKPYYGILALVKAVTAAASVPTAIILFRIAPKVVKLPSLDQMLREQTMRLRAEAQSEAKDRFLAILSHELRTPLTPVRTGIVLLEEELRNGATYASSESVRTAVEIIRHNIDLETGLINDLLDVSSSGQVKLSLASDRVNLRDVLRQSTALFEKEMQRKNIGMELRVRATRTVVLGSAPRLAQVLNNLLENAIKCTEAGGMVTISFEEDGDTLQVAVRDTGCGIEPSNLDVIFRPFEQCGRKNENARGGLGLGLTVAKTLAESHHGTLTAESEGPGRGATFTLRLPLASEEAAPANVLPPQTDPAKGQILLVDDHADTLRTIALLLRRAGYQVATASTIREAEPFLSSTQILISDIGLPDGNGWDLMERFRAVGGTGGIAISGFGQESDVERSRVAGFTEHLVKPIDIERLKRAVAALHAVAA